MSDFSINDSLGFTPNVNISVRSSGGVANGGNNSGNVNVAVPLTPTQEIDFGYDYYSKSSDRNAFEGRYKKGEQVDESFRSVSLASMHYKLNIPAGRYAGNTFSLGAGFLSHKYTDGLALFQGLNGDISSGVFGISDDCSATLMKKDDCSLSANARMRGLGLLASTSYLDYGMRQFNWDNLDLGAGIGFGYDPSPSINITQGYSYGFGKYNPNLYFFLDDCHRHSLPTGVTFKLSQSSSLSFSHILHDDQGSKDATNLASEGCITVNSGLLSFSGDIEHSYLRGLMDGFGARLSYTDQYTDASLSFSAGMRALIYGGKVVNHELYFGVDLGLGKFAGSKPEENPHNGSDLNNKINNKLSFKDVSACLNTPQRISDYFAQNMSFDYSVYNGPFTGDVSGYKHRSPEKLYSDTKGVCGDFTLFQSAMLVENGYPMSYDLGIWRPAPGHAITMTFDPRSSRWLAMENGTCYRLSTRNKPMSPENAAEMILIARGDYHVVFDLYNPTSGFLFQGKNTKDLPDILPGDSGNINTGHVLYFGSLPGNTQARLVPEMGVKTYIGERFWE